MSVIKNLIVALIEGQRQGPSPQVREALKQYGEQDIVGIRVVREPVDKKIKSIVNVVTKGKLNKNIAKYNHDDIFHLYMLVKLVDGTVIKLHKEEVVQAEVVTNASLARGFNNDNTKSFAVEVPPIPFAVFIVKAEKAQPNFWTYDAINNNCQVFVYNLLKYNSLTRGLTKAEKDFIIQDAYQLIDNDPFLQGLLKKVTDLGALFHRVKFGSGPGQIAPEAAR